MANLYEADGRCHNAEPGTYGHECGKPAAWIGESAGGFRSGFCDDCKQHGYEARGMKRWDRIGADPGLPDYDRLIAHAAARVPANVRVEMCRHPSVIMATFWLFRGEDQVAAVKHEGNQWCATKLRRGQAYAQQHIISLDEALQYATAA